MMCQKLTRHQVFHSTLCSSHLHTANTFFDISNYTVNYLREENHHFYSYLSLLPFCTVTGLSGSSDGKASAYNVGDQGSIPGSERSPEEGNGTPLQYSCLENPMDRGAWQATVHRVAKSWTRLSDFTFTFTVAIT